MYCIEVDDALPAWLKAHVMFIQVAHAAEVMALRYTHEQRDLEPKITACLAGLMRGRAQEARTRAALQMLFPVTALPVSSLCRN
jgi:hypothetical protein